jgi:hypothetical protein
MLGSLINDPRRLRVPGYKKMFDGETFKSKSLLYDDSDRNTQGYEDDRFYRKSVDDYPHENYGSVSS